MYKLLCIALAISVSACNAVMFPTESYIKNEIQPHNVGEQSQIKIFRLFSSKPQKFDIHPTTIEFAAYKLGDEKKLVIASEKKVPENGQMVSGYDYVVLDSKQVEALAIGLEEAYSALKKHSKKINELTYVDYTVSPDMFISVVNTNSSAATVQIWINKHRHTVLVYEMKAILGKFSRY